VAAGRIRPRNEAGRFQTRFPGFPFGPQNVSVVKKIPTIIAAFCLALHFDLSLAEQLEEKHQLLPNRGVKCQ
jgi:hypothetical protein